VSISLGENSMPRTTFSALVVLVSVLFGAYQLVLRPLLDGWGVGRVLEARGNSDCIAVPGLKACESKHRVAVADFYS
jgi:arylesterase / paraoxonase